MHLMTWHGTVLSISAEGAFQHHKLGYDGPLQLLTLTPEADEAADRDGYRQHWWQHAGAGELLQASLSGLETAQVIKSRQNRCVHLKRGDSYLRAADDSCHALWDRAQAGVWETFLILSHRDVADLTRLQSQDWAFVSSGLRLRRSKIFVDSGFVLRVGQTSLRLQNNLPLKSADSRVATTELPDDTSSAAYVSPDSFVMPIDESNLDEIVTGRRLSQMPPDQIDIGDLTEEQLPPVVDSYAAFLKTSSARLPIHDRPGGFFLPPACLDRRDLDFFLTRYRTYRERKLPIGPQSDVCYIHREVDKFVVLRRGAEGSIFDETGVSAHRGYLFNLRTYPDSLALRSRKLYASFERLRHVPRLKEQVVVFFNGNLQNYFHWLLDAMLPLDIILQTLDRPATLLLPATIDTLKTFDYRALLHLFKFDRHPSVTLSDDVVAVDQVVSLHNGDIYHVPAHCVQAFRDRALVCTGGRGRRQNRIFIRRAHGIRGIENSDAVEEYVKELGFQIVELEKLLMTEQVLLFQEAEFVIGPHGAGLSNLVFCPTATKVIEISPDCEYRPNFWLLAEKAGLIHGLLPTPTHDGTFNGRLIVDVSRLKRLFRLLNARE